MAILKATLIAALFVVLLAFFAVVFHRRSKKKDGSTKSEEEDDEGEKALKDEDDVEMTEFRAFAAAARGSIVKEEIVELI